MHFAMRRVCLLALLLLATAPLIAAPGLPAAAAGRADNGACHSRAIADLRRFSPHGYAVY
jgi:hypothetical protein